MRRELNNFLEFLPMQILFSTIIATMIKLNSVNYKNFMMHAVINEAINLSLTVTFQSLLG